MFVSTRALVIRSVQYKDADRVLTVLTDKLGRITVKARGASRKNSQFASASQFLCCSDMVLFEKDGRYTLNEAGVIEQFEKLRADLKRMALASYFAEILLCEEEEQQASDRLLRLMLNCLYALAEGRYDQKLIKAAFELRYMTESGYMPELLSCSSCGEVLVSGGRAMPERGEIFCRSCAPAYGIDLSEAAIASARNMVTCELKKLLSVPLPASQAQALSEFSGRYLRAYLERGFRTLDFYNSLEKYDG